MIKRGVSQAWPSRGLVGWWSNTTTSPRFVLVVWGSEAWHAPSHSVRSKGTSFPTPPHPPGEVSLKVRPPAAYRRARVEFPCRGQVMIPTIRLTLILATPAGLRGITGIVAAQRQEEEPRRGIALFQATVLVRCGPGLCGIQGAQRPARSHVGFDPRPTGQRFIAGQIHAAISRLSSVPPSRYSGEDVVHAGKLLTHPVGDAILVANIEYTKLLGQLAKPCRSPFVFDTPQRLRQVRLTAPDGDIQGTLRCASQSSRRRSSVPTLGMFPPTSRSGLTAFLSSYSCLEPHHQTPLWPPASPGRWPLFFFCLWEVSAPVREPAGKGSEVGSLSASTAPLQRHAG